MKRSRLVLVVVLLAVVAAALIVNVWETVTYEVFEDGYIGFNGQVVRVWRKVPRWPSRRTRPITLYYYVDSGFKAREARGRTGHARVTEWTPDGRVARQREDDWSNNYSQTRASPPWWWGVEDQTEPTAPWWGKE